MIWVLMSVLGLVMVALMWALLRISEMQRRWRAEEKADHAKCIAHVSSVTSNRFVASRVRDLADRWDSIEEQAELRRLANEKYTPGGPSMPVIWLREQADRLDLHDEGPVYNLNGERVL